jgi:hypothetical protein
VRLNRTLLRYMDNTQRTITSSKGHVPPPLLCSAAARPHGGSYGPEAALLNVADAT